MEEMKKRLTALVGKVDGLISAEVGFNFNEKGYDLALYSIFKDKAALDGYQVHPDHLKVKEFVHSVITDRAVVILNFKRRRLQIDIDLYVRKHYRKVGNC